MKREQQQQQQQRSYDRSSWCISINEGPLSSLSLSLSRSLSVLQSSTSCSSAAITKALDSCIIWLRFGGGVISSGQVKSGQLVKSSQPSYLRHVSGISIHSTHLSLSLDESSQDLPPAVAPVANTFYSSLY